MGLSKEQFVDIFKKYVYKDPYDFLFMNFDNPCAMHGTMEPLRQGFEVLCKYYVNR
eukprot:SAG31_NODE_224_length_19856_cov_33.632890_12_plen_56_part_00